LQVMTDTKLTLVPYGGSAAAVLGLSAGEIDVAFDSLAVIAPQVQDNRVVGLAITGKDRSSLLPTLPTMAEAGFPDIEVLPFVGLLAPSGTPLEIRQKLSEEIQSILNDPNSVVRSRIETLGGIVTPLDPGQFGEFLTKEIDRWDAVLETAGIKNTVE